MSTTVEARYSYADLERAILLPCNREIAQAVGRSVRTIIRWKAHGIPADDADRVAVAFNEHPSMIWPEQWWDTCPDD